MRAVLLAATLALTTAASDGDYVVFDRGKAAALLQQCSRDTPEIGQAGWTPMAGDILAMEAALPAALAAQNKQRAPFTNAPHGWVRQYVGIVRGGRRYIYGNYFLAGHWFGNRWRTEPMVICDGGPSFFGAEYDVVAKKFTHLAFNGIG